MNSQYPFPHARATLPDVDDAPRVLEVINFVGIISLGKSNTCGLVALALGYPAMTYLQAPSHHLMKTNDGLVLLIVSHRIIAIALFSYVTQVVKTRHMGAELRFW